MGPELPDISSTAVRKALQEGDGEALKGLLHPSVAWRKTKSSSIQVAEWLLEKGIYSK